MSDPQGNAAEPTPSPAHWHVDIGGTRSGPYRSSELVELAKSGRLPPTAHIWRPGQPAWTAVRDVAALCPRRDVAPRVAPPPASTAPIAATRRAESVPSVRRAAALAVGVAWLAVAVGWCVAMSAGWPWLLDGLLIARLEFGGALGLILTAWPALRALWMGTEGARGRLARAGAQSIRIAAAVVVAFAVILIAAMGVNNRGLISVAAGRDPYRDSRVALAGPTQAEIRGPLGAGIASRLATLLRSRPEIRVVHLNSPGGWIREGELLARLIRDAHLDTYTSTGCASACTLAFLAGGTRAVAADARIGFHAASGDGMDPVYVRGGTQLMAAQLRAVGAPESFVARAMATPPSDMWWPDPALLLSAHVITGAPDDRMAPSGEDLEEETAAADEALTQLSALQALSRADPDRYQQLERTMRLLLRRHASTGDEFGRIAEALADAERERVRSVSDDVAARYLLTLRDQAAAHADDEPERCLAILGGGGIDIRSRSEETLLGLDAALATLLSAPADQPAAEAETRRGSDRIATRAAALDPQRFRQVQSSAASISSQSCRNRIWLIDVARSLDTSAVASLLRTFRRP